jgi:hypothetical protein
LAAPSRPNTVGAADPVVRGYAYDEGIGYVTLTLRAHKEEGGAGGLSNFLRIHGDPDDHSPDVESTCNKTGQDCPGKRGGGHGGVVKALVSS